MPDTNWQQRYAQKFATVERAIRAIEPGRRILIGSGAGEPRVLVDGLVNHGSHLADNPLVHLLTMGPAPYVQPQFKDRFRLTAFFIGANVREAVQEGRADFMPVFLSEIPALLRSRRIRVDVALVQVSPPDAHGYMSLGVSVDVVRAAVDTADLVIAEVNPHMPRTHGNSFIHVDQVHFLVPAERELPELEIDAPGPVATEIGRRVASLVTDGATIQVGIGSIPNAVMAELGGRSDLGVHTEMMSDGLMDLIQAGVVTGRQKTLLPGKAVTSFAMGSKALYTWVHDNPAVEMRDSSFTNDPFVISRHDNMVAVNSALAVDLTGQVAADTLMGRFFSGIGGQVDFIRGAARSKGGKPIIALPSTAKKGTVSRIQPALEEGAGVVTSRGDVRYVVTEYGVADLWGKNIRQRANALIEIAHPDFRAELLCAAKRRHYVFSEQVARPSVYPFHATADVTLRDGERVHVRPVRLTDADTLQDLFYRLSDESTYKRFMGHKKVHSHSEIQRLVDVDYHDSMALVVCTENDGNDELVGMVRYDVDPAGRLADIAFVVRDEWQRRGVGTLMLQRSMVLARSRGLRGFSADVLPSNTGMLMVFYNAGLRVQRRLIDGVYRLLAHFE